MGTFLTQGELTPRPERGTKFGWPKFYEVTKPFRYRTDQGKIIEVPVGFYTDGASTGLAWLIVPSWGPYQAGAVIHDYLIKLYRDGRPHEQCKTPLDIDAMFYEVMKAGGTYGLLRNLMYASVRLHNWASRPA